MTPDSAATPHLPRWLKRNVPKGNAEHFTARLVNELRLQTVCDHAKCPNRMECYAHKTATFMVLGNVCTRRCGFCAVAKGKTREPDPSEPQRVAEAAQRLGLRHVVITMVTRDDLPDGGAEHVYRTVEAVRNLTVAAIEVLPSDFAGNSAAVDRLVDAGPEVYNHNTETVPRLYRGVRGRKSDYRWTLEMFRRIKRRAPVMRTKTGLMLGLGETEEEAAGRFGRSSRRGMRDADPRPVPAAHAPEPARRPLHPAGTVSRVGSSRTAHGLPTGGGGAFRAVELSCPRNAYDGGAGYTIGSAWKQMSPFAPRKATLIDLIPP